MSTAAESAVRPCIAALLSRGTAPALMTLVVENIQLVELPSRSLPAIRLLLGDGQLCIQALLRTQAHVLVHTEALAVGGIVALSHYEAVFADAQDGRAMVFLDVERFEVVGQWKGSGKQPERNGGEQGECMTVDQVQNKRPLIRVDSFSDVHFDESFFDPPSSFSKQSSPHPEPKQSFPSTNLPSAAPGPITSDPAPSSKSTHPLTINHPIPKLLASYKPSLDLPGPTVRPVALFRKWHDMQQPLKLTPLGSLPYLPYKSNWTCNILAIVTSLGPVETGALAAQQRVVRVADPTVSAPVRLSVFLDPESFVPPLGVPVLLVGVKNHTYEGGSLNKYESDRPLEGQSWWYTDLQQFPWCNTEGLKQWWDLEAQEVEQ
ncbi:hypothetical protein BROUX41_001114 [Berkeleyomyces rouxiae]|uniref:uncharacterized protein n=1 Tax=Berkeleyomyces rouxiae TaxID=2035830 RepID=UPI003B7B9DB9